MKAFYVVHKSHPGNPWGPFRTLAQAEAFRAELCTWFADDYEVLR